MKVLFRYLGYGFLRGIQGIIAILPPKATSGIGRGLGTLLYACARSRRRVALRNLALAFPGLSADEHDAICRRMFTHFGKVVAEFLRIPAMAQDEITARVRYEHREILDDAISQGRGVLLVTGHFGNWELVSARLAKDGYPLYAIAKATRLGPASRWMSRVRETMGMGVVESDKVFAAARVLKANSVLGILPDQHFVSGITVNFFGHPAKTPTGPAALALMTGAVIVPCFTFRQADDTFVARFYPSIPVTPTGKKEDDLHTITQQITAVIEAGICEAPDHWLWLHDRWRLSPATPRAGQANSTPRMATNSTEAR